jgi:DNA-binding CsgD family transcriptional regulator
MSRKLTERQREILNLVASNSHNLTHQQAADVLGTTRQYIGTVVQRIRKKSPFHRKFIVPRNKMQPYPLQVTDKEIEAYKLVHPEMGALSVNKAASELGIQPNSVYKRLRSLAKKKPELFKVVKMTKVVPIKLTDKKGAQRQSYEPWMSDEVVEVF